MLGARGEVDWPLGKVVPGSEGAGWGYFMGGTYKHAHHLYIQPSFKMSPVGVHSIPASSFHS